MIEIIHQRENEDDITVFFKMDIKEEMEPIEWHCDVRPKDADIQKYLEANEDRYHFLILQKMYRDGDTWADWQRFKTNENTKLQAMQAWIADGHKNQIIVGYYKNENPIIKYQVIEKQPWKSTHPPELALKAEADKATTLADLKEVVKKSIIA